jgi:transcriptional regulator with XRE-family HTH domain
MTLDLRLIGERVAHYRKLNGMSAEALAAVAGAGLTRDIVANIENGRRKDIGIIHMVAIAHALEVPLVALLVPLDRPMMETLDSGTALDALAAYQGWQPVSTPPAAREAVAQLAALHVFWQARNMFENTSRDFERGNDDAAQRNQLDAARGALANQRIVLRGLGVDLDD